ncbi:MAG: FAD-dependent oxidoreductase [Chloroflexi bacterium]|nr:FAD-dependent oxidoreductase [Chloroflexota bacterium]MCI0823397.1 FAD-dependent oxidoreductase [Chloroflexota bacterium]
MASPSELSQPGQNQPPRIVILGGGYGGIYTALKLQKAARRGQIQLDLVSQENFFLSQPMLSEVVSGSIEPTHILNPIRRLLPHANFHQAEIQSVDTESRSVAVRYLGDQGQSRDIAYDYLLIAVGSSTDLTRLPGMAEHAFPFKTLGDAFRLRNHLIGVLEAAEVESDPEEKTELLTFVVAGGGYTGVEVAAEINEFIREAAKSYRHIDAEETKVILLHSGSRILPILNDSLAGFSQGVLIRRGVEVRVNTRIRAATAQSAIQTDGTIIPTRTLVAALGAAPNRLLAHVPGTRDPSGRLVVDETLSVPEDPRVWAVGDCAAVPDLRKGGTCPPTAQFALRQAGHVARNILATIRGQPLKPFSYRSMGVFVPLGRFSGAAEVLGFQVSGFLAWWLYRTFYLYQLPRLERKLRVVIDWTLELFFHRDIVQLDLTKSEGITGAHYEPGEIIFTEGELARNFYTILKGQVEVIRRRNGEEVTVATLGPGEYFGEIALLTGIRRNASIRALSPVDLLVMDGGDFKALAASLTNLGETLGDVMRRRISDGGPRFSPDWDADSPRHPQGD